MDKEKLLRMKVFYYPHRLFMKISKLRYLRPKHNSDQIRVGFLVQLPSIWDKQVDVYNELKRRENVEVFLFAVPQYDWNTGETNNNSIDDYFIKNYPEAINLCSESDILGAFLNFKIDYLFYPRPYDHYLPAELRSYNLFKHVSCCYIPYCLSGSKVFDRMSIYNSFFDNMSIIYMDTKSQYKLMRKRYRFSVFLKKRRIEYLGYPALFKYLSLESDSQEQCITWTPRWSTDSVIGGSNFVNFAESFLQLIKNDNYKYIFRPHPLMFDELISKGVITQQYKDRFLDELKQHNVLFDVSSPIDLIFKKTAVLITDFSSIIPQFFLTGRPIIYCEGGIPLEETLKEMVDLNYYASNWDDVTNHLDSILKEKDDKKKERLAYIESNYKNMSDPVVAIVDDLIKRR